MTATDQGKEPVIIFPDDLEAYMKDHTEGSYALIDVRQPFEYEEGHLPGAKLTPLPQLVQSIADLDPAKPTILYCAVGGRSRMAARLLAQSGFQEVYNLQGGIEAWESQTATGPVDFHLNFIKGDEAPEKVVALAYGMEEGLKRFHEAVKARTEDADFIKVLDQLIRAEEIHERTLLELYETMVGSAAEPEAVRLVSEAGVMEGGMQIDRFMKDNEKYMTSVSGYLNLAMMMEAQALDLYLRMASESKNEISKKILLKIGDEEKGHLVLLGRLFDQKAGK